MLRYKKKISRSHVAVVKGISGMKSSERSNIIGGRRQPPNIVDLSPCHYCAWDGWERGEGGCTMKILVCVCPHCVCLLEWGVQPFLLPDTFPFQSTSQKLSSALLVWHKPQSSRNLTTSNATKNGTKVNPRLNIWNFTNSYPTRSSLHAPKSQFLV